MQTPKRGNSPEPFTGEPTHCFCCFVQSLLTLVEFLLLTVCLSLLYPAQEPQVETLSFEDSAQDLLQESRFHKMLRKEIRQDIEKVLSRLHSQILMAQHRRFEWTDNFDQAHATESAALAMEHLTQTIPPFPSWMKRPDDLWRLHPSELSAEFEPAPNADKQAQIHSLQHEDNVTPDGGVGRAEITHEAEGASEEAGATVMTQASSGLALSPTHAHTELEQVHKTDEHKRKRSE
jgi:hypothetical protein